MGFYSRVILPGLLDSSMSQAEFEVKHRKVIAKASGKVLEIGAGSGLNFKYYGANSSAGYTYEGVASRAW